VRIRYSAVVLVVALLGTACSSNVSVADGERSIVSATESATDPSVEPASNQGLASPVSQVPETQQVVQQIVCPIRDGASAASVLATIAEEVQQSHDRQLGGRLDQLSHAFVPAQPSAAALVGVAADLPAAIDLLQDELGPECIGRAKRALERLTGSGVVPAPVVARGASVPKLAVAFDLPPAITNCVDGELSVASDPPDEIAVLVAASECLNKRLGGR